MVTNQNIDKVLNTLRDEEKRFPDPAVTLVAKRWKSPFLVLISTIMSLRTRDERTILASEQLFNVADTPEKMVTLSISKIEELIYPVGFYHIKAMTIYNISRRLIDEFGGKVPNDLDALISFKGVGRKTANLVLIEGFHIPGVCVDTHVHRVSNRWGYVKSSSPDETETILRNKLPKQYWMEYNSLLVIWGQNICKPVSPLCSHCAVNSYCAKINVVKSR